MTAAGVSALELRDYLVTSAIAGPVATPRSDSLSKYRRMAAGDPRCLFGLTLRANWTAESVLAMMARRCGVSADPDLQQGPDYIDPALTVQALAAMAARLRDVAAAGGTLLIATGHPAGLLAVHAVLARRLQAAGCQVLTPAAGVRVQPAFDGDTEVGELRYLDQVAVVSGGGGLAHTHSPAPMRAMLAALADSGQPAPDLVLADHGFAGAAGAAGLPAVGFADCNDPALFAGEEEGLVEVAVPLDDNVLPHLYEPMTAFLVQQAGL